jgi:hypothetical protein
MAYTNLYITADIGLSIFRPKVLAKSSYQQRNRSLLNPQHSAFSSF